MWPLVLIGAASCGGSPPAAGPVRPSPLSSAPAPSPPIQPAKPQATTTLELEEPSPPPAAATIDPPPPIPEPDCKPPHAVQVPSRFQPLFEKGRHLVYLMGDEVDTHDPSNPHESTKVELICVVRALRQFKKAAASELACVASRGGVAVLPSETLVYVANERGLWVSFTPPEDEEAVKKVLLTPPFLPRNPVEASSKREQPGMFEGQLDQCVDAVDIEGPLACHDTRCTVVQGYGDTRDHWCFSKARGLEKMQRENLEGPRTTVWELREVKPRMPIPKCAKE